MPTTACPPPGTGRLTHQINDYALGVTSVATSIAAKMKTAAGPETVAVEILGATEEPYRMRRPVGLEARLLSRLRRFMPAAAVDRSIRKSFGLN